MSKINANASCAKCGDDFVSEGPGDIYCRTCFEIKQLQAENERLKKWHDEILTERNEFNQEIMKLEYENERLKASAISIDEIVEKINKITEERGWTGKVASTKNLVMALIVEAAELVEIFQWRSQDEELDSKCVHESSMEVADIFIYLLRICQNLGIDILDATGQKLEILDGRPMGYENDSAQEGTETLKYKYIVISSYSSNLEYDLNRYAVGGWRVISITKSTDVVSEDYFVVVFEKEVQRKEIK